MILFPILLISAIVYFLATPNRWVRFHPTGISDAEELLKNRFVSGEINDETYKKMLRTLRSN